MTSQPEVPDIIIERAVELWCRALARPRHDNGDSSDTGFFTQALAGMNADAAIAKVPDYGEAIELFRLALIRILKFKRDHDGEPTGHQDRYGGPKIHYFHRHIGVDYGPDENMAQAAKEAGIPESAFSWKSDVSFYDGTFVSARFGYGAAERNHYPLSDGRWLICSLHGADMAMIIKAVEDDRLPELEVEAPPLPRADGGAGIVTKHSNIAGPDA